MPRSTIPEIAPEQLDLTRHIRANDTVFWGQGTGEPLTLSEALVRQRADIGHINLFIGPSYSQTLQPEHGDHFTLKSYCAIGNNQKLARAGMLDIVPCHYSKLPGLIDDGTLACDVALLQLSAENRQGERSLGVANDYLLSAARRARVVIAEINDQLPWTHGAEELNGLRIDYVLRTSRPVLDVPAMRLGEIEKRIAAHAVHYINDGATLEMGIGAIPDAIIASLSDRKNLGIHSGMLGDSVVDLIESGAVTNSLKPFDHGVSIAGLLLGSARLYRHADRNPAIRLRPASYTHE